MKYQVTVGTRRFDIVVDGARITVDGVDCRAELRSLPGTPLRQLALDSRSFDFLLEGAERGAWVVEAAGERFDVLVLDERTAHIRSQAGTGAAQSAPAVLRAPMPGLVLGVLVEPGQAVSRGQSLVVLEAMKMQNELKAAGPGVVERVAIAPGRTVEKGDVLVTFASAHLT
jgi:pyruvate carboxylase subunit B